MSHEYVECEMERVFLERVQDNRQPHLVPALLDSTCDFLKRCDKNFRKHILAMERKTKRMKET